MTTYPTTTEAPVTRAEYDRLRAIIAALTTDAAVYEYAYGRRICRYCSNTAAEGHGDGCPVGAAKGETK
jgi:hypothetical protein